MNDADKTYCSRCGSEMSLNSRYCMKCGNLNERHPDNNKYSKIMDKNQNTTYQIGSGKKIAESNPSISNNNMGSNVVSNKTTNRLSFILFNVAVIVIMTLIIASPLFSLSEYTVDSVLKSGVLNNFLYEGIFLLSFICMQIVFIKMDEYWWCSFIPFYNTYLMCKKLFGNGWLFILLLIPIVNIVFGLVFTYKLGTSFGKSGILTVLFVPIMLIIIAFGSSAFNNTYYVKDNSNSGLEKAYKAYKNFGEFSLLLILIGLVGFVFTGDNLSIIGKNKDGILIVSGAKAVINKIDKAVQNNKVTCYDSDDNEVSIKMNGEFFFYSNDFLYDYGFSSNLIDTSEGYVKVVNDNGVYTYYITYKAGKMGIKETNSKEVTIDKVEKDVQITKPNGYSCYLH